MRVSPNCLCAAPFDNADPLHPRHCCACEWIQQIWLVDGRNKTVEICRQRGPGDAVRDTVRWRVPATDLIVLLSLREIFAGIE